MKGLISQSFCPQFRSPLFAPCLEKEVVHFLSSIAFGNTLSELLSKGQDSESNGRIFSMHWFVLKICSLLVNQVEFG
jgi:hypothetical protein